MDTPCLPPSAPFSPLPQFPVCVTREILRCVGLCFPAFYSRTKFRYAVALRVPYRLCPFRLAEPIQLELFEYAPQHGNLHDMILSDQALSPYIVSVPAQRLHPGPLVRRGVDYVSKLVLFSDC